MFVLTAQKQGSRIAFSKLFWNCLWVEISLLEKVNSNIFEGLLFYSHALYILSADDSGQSPQNAREESTPMTTGPPIVLSHDPLGANPKQHIGTDGEIGKQIGRSE